MRYAALQGGRPSQVRRIHMQSMFVNRAFWRISTLSRALLSATYRLSASFANWSLIWTSCRSRSHQVGRYHRAHIECLTPAHPNRDAGPPNSAFGASAASEASRGCG